MCAPSRARAYVSAWQYPPSLLSNLPSLRRALEFVIPKGGNKPEVIYAKSSRYRHHNQLAEQLVESSDFDESIFKSNASFLCQQLYLKFAGDEAATKKISERKLIEAQSCAFAGISKALGALAHKRGRLDNHSSVMRTVLLTAIASELPGRELEHPGGLASQIRRRSD